MHEVFLPIFWITAAFAFILIPALGFMENGWYTISWIVFSVLVVAAAGGYVYDHQPPVQSYVLPTSQWSCTSTYQARHFNGKTWSTTTECAQFSRER